MAEAKERLPRELIAMRVAAELKEGQFVNLGIGIPNLVSDFTPPEKNVMFHAENGILGVGRNQEVGKVDVPEMMNAGGQPVYMLPGGWLMDSAESFAIVRGGHLDVAVLGGLQVSEKGDLANWMRPGRNVGSVGGAADIAAGARAVYVAMEHTTTDGELKILRQCTYPLTAVRVVKKVFTDVAVISVTPEGLVLEEVAPGWSPEEVQAITEAPLTVSPSLREIALAGV
ncbi:MAG TPA: 3-oxoacid CoA-transferase subunit B [Dehalococcoidia bacterium]|nr:3-oxoacid CoA-transferase subunit B [Dehalococcoidia bacterium]